MLKAIVTSMVVLMLMTTGAAAKESFTVTPLRGVPLTMDGMQLKAPGDQCDVGVTDGNWAVDGWLLPPEEYAAYSDPADCDPCDGGWLPLEVSVMLYTESACTLTVSAGIREADLSVPGCPVPGTTVCWSSVYLVVLPGAGTWVLSLPLDLGCDVVDGPFFSAIRFEDDPPNAVLPSLVTNDSTESCVSYNDWGSGWNDLIADIAFPGNITIYSTIECQEVAGPYLDIKPTSCPNPLNINSRGVLPAAILGTSEMDVTMIDPASILLAGTVAPLRWSLGDVATPVGPDPELCECNDLGPDGFTDLTVKFSTPQVVAAISPVDDGDEVSVEVTADLFDGTSVILHDCVWIIDKKKDSLRTAMDAPSNNQLRTTEQSVTWGTIKALYR